jgi:predicted dehydrogenase
MEESLMDAAELGRPEGPHRDGRRPHDALGAGPGGTGAHRPNGTGDTRPNGNGQMHGAGHGDTRLNGNGHGRPNGNGNGDGRMHAAGNGGGDTRVNGDGHARVDGDAHRPGPHERDEPPVRVGIVGAGGIAERHGNVLNSLPGVCVAGVTDLVVERAEALAKALGARVYPDARALVLDGDLDALWVCTPPFARGEPELLAADHGIPLFVEKPVAHDLATAEAIAASVEASGIPTAIGYHWRHLDTVAEAQRLLAGRTPGLLAGRWFDKVPVTASWWARRASSGGQLVEQATHIVDLARYLVGEVDRVSAIGAAVGHTGPDGDIDEASAAILGFRCGAVGTLSATCLFDHKRATMLEVVTPGLGIELSELELVVHENGGSRAITPAADAKVEVDRDFVEVVRGRRPRSRTPYGDGLATHRVACAIADSAAEGAPVVLAS